MRTSRAFLNLGVALCGCCPGFRLFRMSAYIVAVDLDGSRRMLGLGDLRLRFRRDPSVIGGT